MKNKIVLTIVLFISITGFAQQGINYKALIKDYLGNALVNATNIDVQFTIYEGAALSNQVYQELHTNLSTDANGILISTIGNGNTTNDFLSIAWNNDEHWLNVQIDIGAGLVDISTTQFMAVPYALNVSGLEKITENDGINDKTGWRLIGVNPEDYGSIGENALDLSISTFPSFTHGATGNESIAIGTDVIASGFTSTAIGYSTNASGEQSVAIGGTTRASGVFSFASGSSTRASGAASTAMGALTEASGFRSTAMGLATIASGDASLAIGQFNIDNSAAIFIIGNGSQNDSRNNALTVLENGNAGIGSNAPTSILEVAHKNGSPEAESLSVLNTDTNNSWQFHTTSYLNLYRNGVFKGSWNATSGAYVQASDKRVKKDIIPLDNGTINKVMQLNPVSYLMKEQTDTKRNLGLISQEVQEIFPSITHYVKESDLLALSYTELIPILIKAMQEQQNIIDAQNAKDVIQDKSIEALVARLSLLESKSSN